MQAEEILQAECIAEYNCNYYAIDRPIIAANYNNPKAIKKEITKGLQPGIPDLTVYYKGFAYFVELKTIKGVLSQNQKRFIPQVQANGFNVFLVRSVDEFIEVIDFIIELHEKPTFFKIDRLMSYERSFIQENAPNLCFIKK